MKKLVCALCGIICAVAVADQVKVAKWRRNAKCAVSYTFDDGLRDQYTLAFPVMKELGIRGTFWLVGAKIDNPTGFNSKAERMTPTMTWAQVKEMAEAGQEMSSHGFNHKSCAKLETKEILAEIDENRKVIKANAGIDALTFAYPFNAKVNKHKESIVDVVEAHGLIGSRRAEKAFGGGLSSEKAKGLVERARKRGEWLVFMTHGIARGYDHFDNPEQFFDHLRWVAKEKDIWVAPFREVCAYEKERNAVKLSVEPQGTNALKVTPKIEGLDKAIFTEKLTLIDKNGKVLTDFDPFGGEFTVSLK